MSRYSDILLNKPLGDGPKPQIDMTKGGQGWLPPGAYWGQQTVYGPMFSGKKLFELKATHGLPLDVAITKIFDDSTQTRIDWAEFIETARSNGWWDYQTIEVMEIALTDSDVLRDYRDDVLQRAKLYMLTNPIDISTALVSKE